MTRIPGPLVDPPEPGLRRYGLFSAANGPLSLPEHGRGGGVRFESVSCGGPASAYRLDCLPPGDQPNNPTGGAGDGVAEALPFAIMATIQCGALGYSGTEFEARVRRRLETGEQGAAEHALWTGEDLHGDPLGVDNLIDSAEDVAALDPDSIVSVVAALEGYAYREQGYAFSATIHAPVDVVAYAAEAGLVVKDGKFLRTPYGSLWAFGGGYPLEGRMFVTGPVTVWRAEEITVYPADLTMDRTTNQRHLLAMREYAVAVECFSGRAEFTPLGGS